MDGVVGYGDILSPEYQEELIALRDSLTRDSFRIGDIVALVAYERPDILPKEIHSAVGAFAGKKSRTVREYAAISRFYPPEVRERYAVLTFDHFRTAMSLGEKWREALDWAVEQTDRLNRPATVDSMETAFHDNATPTNYLQAEEENAASEVATLLNKLREVLGIKMHLPEFIEREVLGLIDKIELAITEKVC
jgi:hypothetical protein